VKFTILPEWFINVSAVRILLTEATLWVFLTFSLCADFSKKYNQRVFILSSVRKQSAFFISEVGKSGPMLNAALGIGMFPVAPRQEVVTFDVSCYFADTEAKLNAKLKDP
jgi:hypothetical protein